MKQAGAAALVLAAGILWGTIGLFIRPLTAAGFTQMQLVLARALLSALVLLFALLLRDRRLPRIRLRDSWIFLGTGVVSFLLFNGCYFTAMQHGTLSVAAILLYTSPIFVMLLAALLFGERITRRKLFSLALAIVGCVLVSGLGGEMSPVGVLFGIGSGFCYALYSIFGRYGLRRYDGLTVTFWTFAAALFGALPLADLPRMAALVAVPQHAWLLLGLGLLCSVLPYLLYTYGLAGMESGKAAVLATIEPVTATLVSVLLFAEPLGLPALCGILLILGAVALLSKKEGAA